MRKRQHWDQNTRPDFSNLNSPVLAWRWAHKGARILPSNDAAIRCGHGPEGPERTLLRGQPSPGFRGAEAKAKAWQLEENEAVQQKHIVCPQHCCKCKVRKQKEFKIWMVTLSNCWMHLRPTQFVGFLKKYLGNIHILLKSSKSTIFCFHYLFP